MINQILPLLNSYLPVHYAIKGLSNINPKMKDFITNAGAAGYATDAILDFLRDKFDTEGAKTSRSQLENKVMSKQARPDEEAALSQIRQSRMPGDMIQKGLSTAAGIGAGMKALGSSKENTAQTSTINNPLQEHAPRAHEFVSNAVNAGNDAISALQHAQSLFKSDVDKALKKSKMGLEDIARFYESSAPQSKAALQSPSQTQAQAPNPKIQALQQAIMEIRKLRGG